jgi:MarR family transcriptional regulator, organic hydroperoxide resistance regulator
MSKYICNMKISHTIDYISRIREGANKFITDELEKAGIKGIVPSHGAILMALYNQKIMTMKEISGKIKRKQPTVTVLIDKLLEYGYVQKEKDDEDSRVTNIRITKKGEDFRDVFFKISEKLNKRLHQGLSEPEVNNLESLLEKASVNW